MKRDRLPVILVAMILKIAPSVGNQMGQSSLSTSEAALRQESTSMDRPSDILSRYRPVLCGSIYWRT